MSVTLATGGQTRWKNSYASSAKVQLTVQANGEETVKVFRQGELVEAGIAAPTVAATVVDGGAGLIGLGYVAYFYVYASTQYPFVEAITAAGGELWPKSNPSPASSIFHVTPANRKNTLTLTKTGAAGVDKILIYRTPVGVDSATAQAYADAGQAYYVGSVDNSFVGTTSFTDNVAASATQEQMELDNYMAPIFWLTVYEPPYWWGIGNPQLNIAVTLNGTSTFTGGPWFVGRNGQTIVFDGITVGGYDGKGSFYFKAVTSTTAQACFDSTLLNAASLPTGTTTARIRGFGGTLYRSKPNNPFAWGWTEDQIVTAGGAQTVESIPQQYAFNIGGSATALAVISTERLLKIDFENPTRSYALNLSLAGTDGFESTLRTLDTRFSVTSHHAQIPVALPSGQTILRGLDAKQFAVVQGAATSQANVSGDIYRTMRQLYTDNDAPRLYHAVYDAATELSVFWVKLATQTDDDFAIDTALCFHGPSGTWTLLDDMGITASAIVFDPVRDRSYTLLGSEDGRLLQAFDSGTEARTYGGAISAGVTDFLITVYETIGTVVGVDGGGNKGITLDAAPLFPVSVGDVIRLTDSVFLPPGETLRTVLTVDGALLNHFTFADAVDPDIGGATCALRINNISDADTGRYMFLTDIEGRRETYGRISATSLDVTGAVLTVNFDRFVQVNSDISPAKVSSAALADSINFTKFSLGYVDCRARQFYNPDSPNARRSMEVWITAQNAVESAWPFQVRFYPELADAISTVDGRSVLSIVEMENDTQPSGGASSMWFNRVDVPSELVSGFAVEIVQRGTGELRLHNFHVQEKL
jgi:hypothetical protein